MVLSALLSLSLFLSPFVGLTLAEWPPYTPGDPCVGTHGKIVASDGRYVSQYWGDDSVPLWFTLTSDPDSRSNFFINNSGPTGTMQCLVRISPHLAALASARVVFTHGVPTPSYI